MKKNMGTADRAIRALIAIAFAILYFTNVVTGTLAIVLMIVSIVFLLTSFISFCPLYTLSGISTNKKSKQN